LHDETHSAGLHHADAEAAHLRIPLERLPAFCGKLVDEFLGDFRHGGARSVEALWKLGMSIAN
jgi:hypothetical protein